MTHDPDAAGFAMLLAVAVTFHPAGGDAGAVYLPVALMNPTVEFPPGMPLTAHVTAVLATPFT